MTKIKLEQAMESQSKANDSLIAIQKGLILNQLSKKELTELYNKAYADVQVALSYSKQQAGGFMGLFGGKDELEFKKSIENTVNTLKDYKNKIEEMTEGTRIVHKVLDVQESLVAVANARRMAVDAKLAAEGGDSQTANRLIKQSREDLDEIKKSSYSLGCSNQTKTSSKEYIRVIGGIATTIYLTEEEYSFLDSLKHAIGAAQAMSKLIIDINRQNKGLQLLSDRFKGLDQSKVSALSNLRREIGTLELNIQGGVATPVRIVEECDKFKVAYKEIAEYSKGLRHPEKTEIYCKLRNMMRLDRGQTVRDSYYVSEEEDDFKELVRETWARISELGKPARGIVYEENAARRAEENKRILESVNIQPLTEIIKVFGLDSTRKLLDLEDALNLMTTVGINGDMVYVKMALEKLCKYGRGKVGFKSLAVQYFGIYLDSKYPDNRRSLRIEHHVDEIAKQIYGA